MIGVVGTPGPTGEQLARNIRHVWRCWFAHATMEQIVAEGIVALLRAHPESDEEREHRERIWDWDARFCAEER